MFRDNFDYVNLYSETEYSLLSSPNRVSSFVNRASEYGYKALAITDYNNLYGAIKFYSLCREKGIKPILGINVSCFTDTNMYSNLLIYARDNKGYQSLLKIATEARLKKEGVSLEFLKDHTLNCNVIIPGDENEIVRMFNEGNSDTLKTLIKYQQYFKHLYLGLDMQTYLAKSKIDELIVFASNNNVECIAINKTSYLDSDDFEAYKILKCIGKGINDYPYTEKEINSSFLNPMQAKDLFRKYPFLIENTQKFADVCNVTIEFGNFKMPVYPVEDNNSDAYLHDLAIVGLSKRIKTKDVDKTLYKNRLLYELDIISKMGFSGYFLFVYDFIKYAKKSDILVGPGRGSAPGSLVAYSLGITEIDPLEYNLLFERFLNPERTSMPDIDTDFPDNKRDEVIKYVGKKYGKEKIAHISTFGTFGVKLALRDIARVKKLNDKYLEEILRLVGSRTDSLNNILSNNEVLRRMMLENKEVDEILNLVRKIEGIPRHVSTHAAGIILANEDLVKYTPLQEGINSLYQTQYEAEDLEKIGLVKTDFLGIRNLTIISDILKKIGSSININKIPYDDKETYSLIASGDTDGIFQLESSGMRKTLGLLKASTFEDIINAIALYRPGPMEMIPTFVNRKHGKERINYLHEDLREILKSTYGIIVFQEQIILIAQKIAGYSLGQAEVLRRAMSKKKADILAAERERFISSSVQNGYSSEVANSIYNYIEKFADYGFNKSHSVAYSMIAYQMSYLKCHYYNYFMATLMSNTIGNIALIKRYINNCNRHNIQVKIPSINKSEAEFIVDGNEIYYSLLGIQNLGMLSLEELLNERRKNGIYNSFDEFVKRTKNILNKRIVESMIYAGALDDFNIPRKQMILEYDNSLELSNYAEFMVDKLNKHVFSDEEFTFEEASQYERMGLGFNLKYNIFSKYIGIKEKYKLPSIAELSVGRNIKILYALNKVNVIKTKKQEEMAFLEISDDTDTIDAVLFPKNYKANFDKLNIGMVYICEASVEMRNEKKQVIIENIIVIK